MDRRQAWERAALVVETEPQVPRLSVIAPQTGLLDRGYALHGAHATAEQAMAQALADVSARAPFELRRVFILHDGHAPPALSPVWSRCLPAEPVWLDSKLCAVWGEAEHGAGEGERDQLHLGLGSVVSGLVLKGRPFAGARGHGASPACFCVDPRGPPCACGARGHLAAYTDLPGLRLAGAHLGLSGARPPRQGRDIGVLLDLVERAQSGCPLARRVLRRAGHALGLVAGALLNALDRVRVVVHCPVQGAWPLVEAAVMAALERHSFAAVRADVQWSVATLGGEAAPMGAVSWPGEGSTEHLAGAALDPGSVSATE